MRETQTSKGSLMSFLLVIGRVLFVLIFLMSGAQKLMDINGTAQQIATHVSIPAALAPYEAQVTEATGYTVPQIMAVVAGLVEVIGGLLIAFNIATRATAIIMALYVVAATLSFHNFWTMQGPERMDNMIHAMKNVSIFGGFLIIAAIGGFRARTALDDRL
jgi:putative oxidoreductase